MLAEFTHIIQRSNAASRAIKIESQQLHGWLYADCEQYLNSVFHYDNANKIMLKTNASIVLMLLDTISYLKFGAKIGV